MSFEFTQIILNRYILFRGVSPTLKESLWISSIEVSISPSITVYPDPEHNGTEGDEVEILYGRFDNSAFTNNLKAI